MLCMQLHVTCIGFAGCVLPTKHMRGISHCQLPVHIVRIMCRSKLGLRHLPKWCRACCSALKNFDILEETLSDGRKYLVNNEFSIADIAVGYAGQTRKMLGVSSTRT